ncbi:hypothetical protein [Bailinhaonella thermotolerans]|uniref:Uncharacterized protein n=1 Tax=Bailinhaonella thermotolerans TaxID=1070861 RepID=A0A3A4BFY7_9ACTN|nr:hypothetical protein [Bailinhaonella thermotolerans]RJL33402.1 hypothetical protein D5H75_11465 [Bailinhaonella thermotolerans]
MRRLLARLLPAVAVAVAALVPAGTARAADGAPYVRVHLDQIIAYDLEESGHDEIFVRMYHDGSGKPFQAWPMKEGDELSVAARDCVSFREACPAGTNQRSGGGFYAPRYPTNLKFLYVQLWEDDLAGDDLLMNVPVGLRPISEEQRIVEEAQIGGHHYVLKFTLTPVYL